MSQAFMFAPLFVGGSADGLRVGMNHQPPIFEVPVNKIAPDGPFTEAPSPEDRIQTDVYRKECMYGKDPGKPVVVYVEQSMSAIEMLTQLVERYPRPANSDFVSVPANLLELLALKGFETAEGREARKQAIQILTNHYRSRES